jgi:hypothetical protein
MKKLIKSLNLLNKTKLFTTHESIKGTATHGARDKDVKMWKKK